MKQKYRLLRNSATDQRVFTGEGNGAYYLADHSADDHGVIGRPNETDDGPLRLNPDGLTQLVGEPGLSQLTFRLPVIVERTGKASCVGCCFGVALFISDHLRIPILLRLDNKLFALRETGDQVT